MAMNASGSSVTRSASTSARVSICRLIVLSTGLASSEPTATRASTSGTDARVPHARPRRQRSDHQPQQPDAEDRAGDAEHRPGHHVRVLGVRELVGDDGQRLVLRQPLDQVVVDHDPPGAAEARDVGVERRRTPGRVRHQHLVHVDALAVGELEDLGAQLPVLQRLEGVEHRLDEDRVDERPGDDEQTEDPAGDRGPRPPPPARRADQHQEQRPT